MNARVGTSFLHKNAFTNPSAATTNSQKGATTMPTEEEYRELDLLLGDARNEINTLRRQLRAALDEALWLRQQLESVHAVSHMALHAGKSERTDEGRTDVAETEQN